MSSIERYDIWCTIRIIHEYYNSGNCPVVLAPSSETSSFFRRNRILYKMIEQNKWVLLTMFRDFTPDTFDTLCFEMIPQDNIFYYVTELSQKKEDMGYTLKESPAIGKKMCLSIPLDALKEKIDIKLEAKLRYWEFIIIPRHTAYNVNLRIEEKRDVIKFGNIEKIDFPRQEKAFRVSTLDKNKLKETQEYIISLYEVKNNGERLLSANIPLPRPDELSIIQPGDTITTYFYI